ncbi:hypothetical protein [Paraurantiacibacter namhicola]|uniref:Lipoprotein n=1 Tax=Paraurantiacibacter namhicola TaxID=645517 RepID=A0A1C7D4T9_9SPHN|nr:hypothetical protein [Paraurantiacibacter namhicola]ANU06488.1 hypothetical protein A6F65_00161 [Paraurantiacibacter namhicola]
MKLKIAAIAALAATGLSGCMSYDEADEVVVSQPPMGPGAIAGTVAADRDGDGVVDGYYRDGYYYAFEAPPCPVTEPAYVPAPSGERG